MKRIIAGVTYDTETATEVCGGDAEHSSAWWQLYQTRHGAFFKVVCDHDGETLSFVPLSDDEAQELVERHANHLVEQYFGLFPEYGSAERRLTLRIPIGLARRVEAAAERRGQPVNRYIARCLERCVRDDGREQLGNPREPG
jgi:predicted DNA binding CopG/RHH family protein